MSLHCPFCSLRQQLNLVTCVFPSVWGVYEDFLMLMISSSLSVLIWNISMGREETAVQFSSFFKVCSTFLKLRLVPAHLKTVYG